ncbi:ERC protein 2-like [Impatiens glandulifera]|uniref:ERC protein 2-like n=1 Tax=Impatiens glandulifera TaxID=253017 RepID=UPI001FB1664A|nr:ERC protein 2-like [Impatiens glandulifera]
MRKLTERYVAGTSKAKLQVLVLDILTVKKGEFIDEIERLEAVCRQQDTAHSPRLETGDGQNPGDKSPLTDQAINETDDRTEPPITENLESNQPGDSESAITEKEVITIINEFANTNVRPWKKKVNNVVVQTIKLAETIRDDLVKANEWITSVETNYCEADARYGDHLKRTIDLEEMTPKLADDLKSVTQRVEELERFQEKTEQRLTKVDEDLGRSSTEAGSTLDRVTSLEEKNASLEERNNKLEADLKAVTEQVNELINAKLATDRAVEEANAEAAKKIQDALDEETRKTKEAPRLSEADLAERARNVAARNPALAKSIAAQEAKDVERLNTEKQRLDEYAKAHKKSKAAPSSSVSATRKRKIPSRKTQVTEMLGRITETVIDSTPDPALQTEDDFEEDLEPRHTRHRVINAVPISTVGQPFSPHQDTTGAGGSSSRPAQPVEDQPTDDLMGDFLPSRLE